MDWRSFPLRRGSSGPNRVSVKRTPAHVLIPFAPPTYCFSAFAEAHLGRIRTVELHNREQRAPRQLLRPEPAVSGSDSAASLSQDPAKARAFPGGSRSAGAKSLQARTRWRWWESTANPSLGLDSLIRRENTGNSAGFEGIAARRGSENARSPATFGGISLGRAPRKVDPCHAEAYREQGPFCRTGPGCDGLGG
jgi:hypothetical protein